MFSPFDYWEGRLQLLRKSGVLLSNWSKPTADMCPQNMIENYRCHLSPAKPVNNLLFSQYGGLHLIWMNWKYMSLIYILIKLRTIFSTKYSLSKMKRYSQVHVLKCLFLFGSTFWRGVLLSEEATSNHIIDIRGKQSHPTIKQIFWSEKRTESRLFVFEYLCLNYLCILLVSKHSKTLCGKTFCS